MAKSLMFQPVNAQLEIDENHNQMLTAKDRDERTPLQFACGRGHAKAVKQLLHTGRGDLSVPR